MAEKIIAVVRPTRLLFLRNYIISLLLMILGFLMFLGFLPTTDLIPKYFYLGFFFIGLIPAIIAELRIRDDTYIFTTHKITERVGSTSIQENTVSWDRLSNYSLRQSFIDRIFGVGTIDLWSIGEEMSPEISIKKVSHIKKVIELLDKLMKTRSNRSF